MGEKERYGMYTSSASSSGECEQKEYTGCALQALASRNFLTRLHSKHYCNCNDASPCLASTCKRRLSHEASLASRGFADVLHTQLNAHVEIFIMPPLQFFVLLNAGIPPVLLYSK